MAALLSEIPYLRRLISYDSHVLWVALFTRRARCNIVRAHWLWRIMQALNLNQLRLWRGLMLSIFKSILGCLLLVIFHLVAEVLLILHVGLRFLLAMWARG